MDACGRGWTNESCSKRLVTAHADRGQSTLFPECLDDWIEENNPVRVIDAFVDLLDLSELSFEGIEPAETDDQLIIRRLC
jgi:transposase